MFFKKEIIINNTLGYIEIYKEENGNQIKIFTKNKNHFVFNEMQYKKTMTKKLNNIREVRGYILDFIFGDNIPKDLYQELLMRLRKK